MNKLRYLTLLIFLFPWHSQAQDRIKGTTYALIVGISNYQYIQPLKYADKDAALFRDYMKSKAGGNVKDENILFLVNDDAKGGTLNARALSWIENRKYNSGDRLFIYLAGHGDAIDEDEYFFLGSDLSTGNDGAKNNYTAGFTLQMYNLKARIKRIKAKGVNVTLIMDACRSNELAGGEAGQKMFAGGVINNHVGEIMMLSAGAGQSAIESANLAGGHGLFTYVLISGLAGEADKNNDGKIDMYELSSYVKDNVRDKAYKTFNGHRQSPDFSGYTDDTQIFAYVDSDYHKEWLKNENMISTVTNTDLAVKDKKRGASDGKTDSTIIKLYNKFTTCLKQNRLSGENSAEYYYEKMEHQYPKASLTEDAKYTLLSEYLNYIQGKTNIVLKSMFNVDAQSKKTLLSLENESSNKVRESSKFKFDLISELPSIRFAEISNKAIKLVDNDSVLHNKLHVDYLYFNACSYTEANNHNISFEKALENINNAITIAPNEAFLYNALAVLKFCQGDLESAEISLKKAIEIEPNWVIALSNLSSIYGTQKNLKEYERFYNKARDIDSNFFEVYFNISESFSDSTLIKSISFLKRSIKTNPENIMPYVCLANYYYSSKNYYEAELLAQKAFKIDSTNINSSEILANIYLKQGKKLEVEKIYKSEINSNSTSPLLYNKLGVYYADLNETSKAKDCFLNAIKYDPTFLWGYYNLSCIYSKSNNITKSYFYIDKCFKLGFKDYNSLMRDNDLVNLKSKPEFSKLIEKYFPDEVKKQNITH